jgi:large conductance mechanosensitive channel
VIKGFREFILRGNVIDLAVAVVIGAAFGALIKAFTEAFIEPVIRLLLPGDGELAGTFEIGGETFNYALFVNAAIIFLLTALAVYLFIVVPANKARERFSKGDGDVGPSEIELLTEIRDELRRRG